VVFTHELAEYERDIFPKEEEMSTALGYINVADLGLL
jgi:hypothetical protein